MPTRPLIGLAIILGCSAIFAVVGWCERQLAISEQREADEVDS